jgi:hypothetical protein
LRLLLDEHYSPSLARALRDRGHDVEAFAERADLVGATDEAVLAAAAREGRGLVTNNARHLVPIAGRRLEAGGSHYGLILTSDRTFPRGREAIGGLTRALEALLTSAPADDALTDQTRWLTPVG